MEGCLIRVNSAGVGAARGVGYTSVTFSSGGVYQYGPSGGPISVAEEILHFTTFGNNWQTGAGGTIAVGPLFKIL